MDQLKYKRVLLKISGEALAGEKHFGFDFDVVSRVCDVIRRCNEMGVQMGVVIGGGNFWRGVKNGEGYIERTRADHMGMLATAMNCMAVADAARCKCSAALGKDHTEWTKTADFRQKKDLKSFDFRSFWWR